MTAHVPRTELDAILFSALRAVYQFERSKMGLFDLTYEEIYLLQYLRRRSPARMSLIAEEMKKPVSTATRLMDRMESRGLVHRNKDRQDKRTILVTLSSEGRRLVQRVEDHTHERIMDNLIRFSPSQIAAFVETARHLEQILAVTSNEKEMP